MGQWTPFACSAAGRGQTGMNVATVAAEVVCKNFLLFIDFWGWMRVTPKSRMPGSGWQFQIDCGLGDGIFVTADGADERRWGSQIDPNIQRRTLNIQH
jgi:hypothetical protein